MFVRTPILAFLISFSLNVNTGLADNTSYGGTDHLVSSSNAMVLNNRGIDLMEKGYLASARKFFDAAIQQDHGAYILYYNRAAYFRETHQWQLALQDLNSCIRLKPTFQEAFVMRGTINDRLGNFRDSLADYDGLVKLNPRNSWTLDCRASLLATCPDAAVRNGQSAINDATTACKISTWDNPQFIDTLAAAYAEAGDFDSAIRFEEKAIAQARKAKAYTIGMERRLALYRQHKPYREPRGESPRSRTKPGERKTIVRRFRSRLA